MIKKTPRKWKACLCSHELLVQKSYLKHLSLNHFSTAKPASLVRRENIPFCLSESRLCRSFENISHLADHARHAFWTFQLVELRAEVCNRDVYCRDGSTFLFRILIISRTAFNTSIQHWFTSFLGWMPQRIIGRMHSAGDAIEERILYSRVYNYFEIQCFPW